MSPAAVKEAIQRLLDDAPLREALGRAASRKQVVYTEDIRLLTELLDG